jgi:hypothetical protein
LRIADSFYCALRIHSIADFGFRIADSLYFGFRIEKARCIALGIAATRALRSRSVSLEDRYALGNKSRDRWGLPNYKN